MDTQYQITRCPMCGSPNLMGIYDDRANKQLTKGALWFGLVGLIVSAFRTRNATSAYWECQNCGHIFRMDD